MGDLESSCRTLATHCRTEAAWNNRREYPGGYDHRSAADATWASTTTASTG